MPLKINQPVTIAKNILTGTFSSKVASLCFAGCTCLLCCPCFFYFSVSPETRSNRAKLKQSSEKVSADFDRLMIPDADTRRTDHGKVVSDQIKGVIETINQYSKALASGTVGAVAKAQSLAYGENAPLLSANAYGDANIKAIYDCQYNLLFQVEAEYRKAGASAAQLSLVTDAIKEINESVNKQPSASTATTTTLEMPRVYRN